MPNLVSVLEEVSAISTLLLSPALFLRIYNLALFSISLWPWNLDLVGYTWSQWLIDRKSLSSNNRWLLHSYPHQKTVHPNSPNISESIIIDCKNRTTPFALRHPRWSKTVPVSAKKKSSSQNARRKWKHRTVCVKPARDNKLRELVRITMPYCGQQM